MKTSRNSLTSTLCTFILLLGVGISIANNIFCSFRPKVILCCSSILATTTFSLGPLAWAQDDKYASSITGVDYFDYKEGDGAAVQMGSKVSLNYKGRLAGRQGWIYDDTFASGEPIRVVIGTTKCIPGLEIGLTGDGEGMSPMKKGSKRRLVIPSRLGYTSKDEQPIPQDFSQQQRLYGTVLNEVRGAREREALGDSITGKLVLDVEVLRVSNKGM